MAAPQRSEQDLAPDTNVAGVNMTMEHCTYNGLTDSDNDSERQRKTEGRKKKHGDG
jgi:hypothetical protein